MDRSRGVARFVRRQVKGQHGDFARRAETAHGLTVDEGLLHGGALLLGALASVSMRSSSEGLSIVPGQMALQRMPRLMKSAATALDRPITAALAGSVDIAVGIPRTEDAPDAMLMIEPRPCSSMPGRTALMSGASI